ncbi:hypothetical protein BJ912DRAFT_1078069 [Pholiota molesta]|nr:hypothetical protein BJ912DRAFT_1078069 [Pholiota molesta]
MQEVDDTTAMGTLKDVEIELESLRMPVCAPRWSVPHPRARVLQVHPDAAREARHLQHLPLPAALRLRAADALPRGADHPRAVAEPALPALARAAHHLEFHARGGPFYGILNAVRQRWARGHFIEDDEVGRLAGVGGANFVAKVRFVGFTFESEECIRVTRAYVKEEMDQGMEMKFALWKEVETEDEARKLMVVSGDG